MNIGIDLDGVIYNSENWMIAKAELLAIDNKDFKLVNPETNDIKLRYGLSDTQAYLFRKQYYPMQILQSPLMPLAKESIEKLQSMGHKIIIITSRGTINESDKALTEKRLKDDNIPFDKLIFSSGSKLDYCQSEQIDIMIDDSYKIVDELTKNGVKCIQFCQSNFTLCYNKNAKHAYNWGEIVRKILNKGENYEI